MFWFSKRRKKVQTSVKASRKRSRFLRFEGLECRAVLAAGVVDVQIFPFIAAGTLNLEGDGSNNEVDIQQTVNVGEYLITGRNGTLLSINGGAGVTFPSLTVNGIIDDMTVDLGDGDDVFRFLGTAAGGDSNVPTDLSIENDDGSDRNTLDNVLVNGNLTVTKTGGSSGYSELHILSSTIIGFTTVDNTGGGTGGDTETDIDNSWLQGNGGPGAAFTLVNGSGKDIIDIRGNSQFGVGPFPLLTPVITISNGDGGSVTTFTGASAVAGFGTTTVYGDLSISNSTNIVGTLDSVTFISSNVLGDVDISNGIGDTTVVVTNSTLGSHLVAPPFSPVIGSPLTIFNAAGFDQFSMTGSQAPWGLYINNDLGGPTNWGSQTSLTNSQVGNSPFGPDIPGFPNAAMVLLGDTARDTFTANNTQFGGVLDLRLFAGNNDVNLSAASRMAAFRLATLGGNDSVLIDDTTIQVAVEIDLGAGADRLIVTNVTPDTEWPSALLGSIAINGGIGVDTTNLSALALGALGFEIFVP